MSVVMELRKSRSWDTTTSVFFQLLGLGRVRMGLGRRRGG
jgi:hypothetical protein